MVLLGCPDSSAVFDYDGDGDPDDIDCDPDDPTIHGGAAEECNDGVDNDCDGDVDEDDNECSDLDADGYPNDVDCDPLDPTVHPGADEVPYDGIDQDCLDGDLTDVDGDGHVWDGVAGGDDCDDDDPDVHPGAVEECDEVDNNCDGAIDEADPDGLDTFFADADGDGFGDPEISVQACFAPADHVVDDTDCDDTRDDVYPGAPDVCDDVADNDCDEVTDPSEADGDGDGYSSCDGDCDDAAPSLSLDDLDADGYSTCDGDCDDALASLNLDDLDADGYSTCDGDCDDDDPWLDPGDLDGDGTTSCDGDCDDLDAGVHPGATELPGDGVDQNCDGYDAVDLDGDGHLSLANGGDDCDDTDATVYPGAPELCDGLDNDCDPSTEEDTDADADGYTRCHGDCDDADPAVSPAAAEVCDGSDSDCDGIADDGCVTCALDVPGDHTFIEQALLAAAANEVVCVQPGTYTQTVVFDGVPVHVLGVGGPQVTVIDAGGAAHPVEFRNGDGLDTIFEGFTVTGGYHTYGGGIWIDFSGPTLRHLIVTGNEALQQGGGIRVGVGTALLEDVVVSDNVAGANGGGLYLVSDASSFSNVVVTNNEAESGGGIYMHSALPAQLDNVVVADNVATVTHGGGIYFYESTVDANNLQITGNEADLGWGGGVFLATSYPVTLTNAVVAGNSAIAGAGVYYANPINASLVNSIIADNVASTAGGGIYGMFDSVSLNYCNVVDNSPTDVDGAQPFTAGVSGNISEAPFFADTSAAQSYDWDLHLSTGSWCIDSGDLATTDPDGGPGDMGMYGGAAADGWDRDLDTYLEWWQPGPYDPLTYPGLDWDCDDRDPTVVPGDGC